jgi:hypothetical protein
MAFVDLYSELRGQVAKLPITFAKTLTNRAYRDIRESFLWSFNLFESSWSSPALVTAGTVTVVQGSASVTFDATAIAALLASQTATPTSPITTRQFRVSIGGIYSLISFDFGTGIATLDRIYGEASAAGSAYQVYQAYYVPPMKDFLSWISVRNPSTFFSLNLTQTRKWVDARDPQRMVYGYPSHVVPFAIDLRGAGTPNASATLGFPMFELWGQATAPYVYQCYGIRRGIDLSLPTDTLPIQIGDDLVLAKAKALAYEWAEANKDTLPRAAGPDYKFLIGQSQEEYKSLLKKYRKQDREFIDNYFSVRDPSLSGLAFAHYNSLVGFAGTGATFG